MLTVHGYSSSQFINSSSTVHEVEMAYKFLNNLFSLAGYGLSTEPEDHEQV